jgi:hypothetical protein
MLAYWNAGMFEDRRLRLEIRASFRAVCSPSRKPAWRLYRLTRRLGSYEPEAGLVAVPDRGGIGRGNPEWLPSWSRATYPIYAVSPNTIYNLQKK